MPRQRQRKNKKTQPSLKVLIKRKIDRRIKDIKHQYKVVWSEQDGCDEDGFKYWVECVNGYSGRSWDAHYQMTSEMRDYISYIINNGIYIKGKNITQTVKSILKIYLTWFITSISMEIINSNYCFIITRNVINEKN